MCARTYLYSPQTNDGDCTLGSFGTIGSPFNIDSSYTYSTTFPGGSGLSNPLVYTGDAWGVSTFICLASMEEEILLLSFYWKQIYVIAAAEQ